MPKITRNRDDRLSRRPFFRRNDRDRGMAKTPRDGFFLPPRADLHRGGTRIDLRAGKRRILIVESRPGPAGLDVLLSMDGNVAESSWLRFRTHSRRHRWQ